MICPFMDLTDPRCADHFNLVNLTAAFSHCVGRYQSCPVYQTMTSDHGRPRQLGGGRALPVRAAVPGRLAG